MRATVTMKRIGAVSPGSRARMAGGVYVFTLLTAALLEWLFGDTAGFAAGLLEIVGMVAVTLLLYGVFKPVNRNLSLLAALFNLVGITIEAIRLAFHGSDIAMVFHGIFCILIGTLIFRSTFLPRILGALIAFGGLAWLTYMSPSLAHSLSPYNLAIGLLGEISMFLWLLVKGVNVPRWKEQAGAA
jgi:hypothetical protein